jgi:hypothetical protein
MALMALRAAGIILTLVGTAGCSSGTNNTNNGTEPAANYDAALLTTDDLPPGFAKMPTTDLTTSGYEDDCPPLSEPAPPEVKASITFQHGASLVNEMLLEMPSKDTDDYFNEITPPLDDCVGAVGEQNGFEVTITAVEPLRVATLGDETRAVKINAQAEIANLSIQQNTVAIRQGNVAILMTYAGWPTVDIGLTESTTRAAYDKALDELNL